MGGEFGCQASGVECRRRFASLDTFEDESGRKRGTTACLAALSEQDEWLVYVNDILSRVASLIDSRRLLAPREKVLVAVSGGADSVGLLAAMRELALRPGREYRLAVGHLDHGLRPTAAGDAAFVAELAAGWGIEHVAERRDVRRLAARRRLSIETAGRSARYEFLAEAARRCGASAVAAGHHADDNVETVLARLVRGTHLRGLAGIPAQRPLGEGVRLVRPLLCLTRRQIEEFCRCRGLEWRTDPTNADVVYRRNYIRRELLPLLRDKLNPLVDEAIARVAEAAAVVEDYMAAQGGAALRAAMREAGGDAIVLDAGSLAALHPAVRTYALRAALEHLGCPLRKLTAEHMLATAELTNQASGKRCVNLPGFLTACLLADTVRIERRPPSRTDADWELELAIPGRTELRDGRSATCTLAPFDGAELDAHRRSPRRGVELLDADRVHLPLRCRPRRPGDSFIPLGDPGTQTVSDFLTNARLPKAQRGAVLCVLDAEGLVYLAPLRIADRVKVTAQTRTVLRVEVAST